MEPVIPTAPHSSRPTSHRSKIIPADASEVRFARSAGSLRTAVHGQTFSVPGSRIELLA